MAKTLRQICDDLWKVKVKERAGGKCEKCGKIFFPGESNGDLYDTCPECGFSKIEQKRNK